MEDKYIEFKDVSKHYNGIKALDGVSLSIKKGDIFGYIGPNGAGKTTTIKILVGLIRNYQGNVLINSTDISKRKHKYYKILGYIPQETGFQEWRTIDHALSTFGKLSGLKSEHLEMRIKEVLDLVSLSDVRYKKIIYLSGGMKQKLLFAQAILHDPEILIMDEPMSGLDPTSRYQMKEIIKGLANTGITIFLSSHILSDVQDISTRIGILNKGKLLKSGSPSEIQREFQVENKLEIEFAEGSLLNKNLENLFCINTIKQISDNKLLIYIKSDANLDACIKTILEEAINQNCRIRNFNVLKPSLEDVYLKYIRGEIQ